MEHRLLRIEFGYWWKDASRIARQQDNVRGMIVRYTWNLGIFDVLNWICTAGY